MVTKGLQHTNAFVIQFRAAAKAGAARSPGRIEHVASGRTSTFESIEELPQLLLRMLQSSASADNNEIG
jgi:hypothetical protein